MGRIGAPEIIFIALAIILLFGIKKLPEIGASLGKAIREFKNAGKDDAAVKDSTSEEKEKLTVTKESVLGHMDELRSRILKVFLVWIICCAGIYPFIDSLLEFIIQPVGQVVFISPAAAFMAEFKLALLAGFFFSSPVLFYQVWCFVSSGLKEKEQKFVKLFGPLSLISFLLGAAFAYFVALPFSLHFLLGFQTPVITPMITIESYISFFMSMVLAFGCIFEMPLILVFLTAIGIATPAFLIQKRRHAVILLLIVSALITPPDIVSLFIMTGPLIVLYEVGIWASQLTFQKKMESKQS